MTLLDSKRMRQFDYRWHSLSQVHRSGIPKAIYPWLKTRHSMTTKLRQAGILTVEVLADTWHSPSPRERIRLRLKLREKARVRSVILKVNDEPVIYARSIIPARSLKGAWRFLPFLGNRPLGGYVYQSKRLKRSAIEVVKLPQGLILNADQPLWARRSTFIEYGPGVLVNEAFYPSIGQFTDAVGQL